MIYKITEPCTVNKARFVLITTFKQIDDSYVSDKEFLCKNIDIPYRNNSSYNLLNMLTDYLFKDRYINNPYKLLREHAIFIDKTILKIVNGNVVVSDTVTCIDDVRREIRKFGDKINTWKYNIPNIWR